MYLFKFAMLRFENDSCADINNPVMFQCLLFILNRLFDKSLLNTYYKKYGCRNCTKFVKS